MFGFIESLFSTEGLSPHSICLYGRDDLIFLHVVSDCATAFAYFTIPIAILFFITKRKDLQFRWIFALFSAFIIACGTTHILGALTFWEPVYGLEALVKVLTAILSIVTAIAIWPLIPRGLAIPSLADLEASNRALMEETLLKARAQEELFALNAELETRIEERTRQLEEARLSAEHANKSKSEFLAMMSHELRTPLNTIIGFSEILRDGSIVKKSNERLSEYASDIYESGNYLLSLINDILDLSKIDAGKIEVDKRMINVVSVINNVMRLLALRAVEGGLTISYHVEESVKSIYADERAIKQILFNLISNAIKYTKRDGKIAVSIDAMSNGSVMITVSDTGIGIPKEKIPLLGQPFQMVDNRYARARNSTGLGLALVRGLVSLHEGTMMIESSVGKGTTVQVIIPHHRTGPENSPVT